MGTLLPNLENIDLPWIFRALIPMFLAAFITFQGYGLIERKFPKVLFKLSPDSIPKDGGMFNFYLRQCKFIIGLMSLVCLGFYLAYLIALFIGPEKEAFLWKAFLILFIAATPVSLIWSIVIYLSDLLYEHGLKGFKENSLNNKYYGYFWKLLGIAFVSGFVLPAYDIGLPYSLYIYHAVLIIFFLALGMVYLEVTVEQNREERIKEIREIELKN